MLTARKLVQSKLQDIENSLRRMRGFGLKVGKTTEQPLPGGSRSWWQGIQTWRRLRRRCWRCTPCWCASSSRFEKRVRSMAKADTKAKLLMSTPRSGRSWPSPTASAISDTGRFKSSKQVGPHFELRRGSISPVRPILLTSCSQSQSRAARNSRIGRCGSRGRRRKGQKDGGTFAQARGDHASHAGRRNTFQLKPHRQDNGCGSSEEHSLRFSGGTRRQPSPKRSPFAGTMDQADPPCRMWHRDHASVDWPTYPLRTPSGGGLAPTPYRSKSPVSG